MSTRIPFVPEPIFSFATDIASIWIRGTKFARVAIALAISFAAVAAVLVFFDLEDPAKFLAGSAFVLSIGVLAYQRALERSERAERIVEIEKEVEANPDKAKPAWDLASVKLEEYVARNLSQVAWIFVLVLIVMTIGFVFIGWGIYKVFSDEARGNSRRCVNMNQAAYPLGWSNPPGRDPDREGGAVMDKPQPTTTTPTPQASRTWERLEDFVREHVQQFIQALLEEEVTELLGRTKSARREAVDATPGYRNGYGKPRQLTMTSGTITVRRPRVRNLNERFVSRVLPLFKRQTKEVGELLPQLYLHGLALGDFELALRGLLGDGAPLSPASLLRLKTQWQAEYETWKRRRLDDLEVVYVWADGLYVKAGLEDTKAAFLVMIGALSNGQKVVLAVESGQRESKESWGMMLRDLRKRGLKPWRCTIADGHLGLWAALGEQYSTLAEQRCWNHKITNVLDALAKKHQAEARTLLCAMPYAEAQAACETLRAEFTTRYRKLAPKAVERLADDWERLVTFYQFPREHWPHLRTSNVVESPFATVRLRTTAAKRFKKVENATALVWKMLQVAESTFRRLKGAELLPDVYARGQYCDGIKRRVTAQQALAA